MSPGYDGAVNTLDFNLLAGNFNKSLAVAPAGLGNVVPESGVPAAMLALSALRRGRRSNLARLEPVLEYSSEKGGRSMTQFHKSIPQE